MNKAALLFRSPSTTPDVIQLPTTYTSQFASSGYLLPLDSLVKSASNAPFWAGMPKNVQDMGRYNGTLYSINNGNNDFGVFYNKTMFKQAGLPTNWQPKNWNDILKAAEAIHKKLPKVAALWLAAGVAAGPTNILQGIGNLIVGTKEPTMFDTKTGSYVVGSGLSDALELLQEGLLRGARRAGLEAVRSGRGRRSAAAVRQAPARDRDRGRQLVPVGVGGEGLAGRTSRPRRRRWASRRCRPSSGRRPARSRRSAAGASAVAKGTKYPQLAWNLVKLMMDPANQLTMAVWAGFVPPDTNIGASKAFVNSAPFQAQFNDYAKYGAPLPSDANFPIYARAVNTATGDFVQKASSTRCRRS